MEELLLLEHVSKSFTLKGKQKIQALHDINLTVYRGETLGIVGESGSGKSTLARMILGVYPCDEGTISFRKKTIKFKKQRERLKYAKSVQMIFQNPYSSLNPRLTVKEIIAESFVIHKLFTPKEREDRVYDLLEAVGIPADYADRFPEECSGGQRQRIGIARALALDPELLVCDEPISALDISTQSQIVNLLVHLKESLSLTYIFIAHDMRMVRFISNRIAVMYQGHIVELAESDTLYENPMHPYTKLLLEAVLTLERMNNGIMGSQLQENNKEKNNSCAQCPFEAQCPYAMDICREKKPGLIRKSNGHFVACHKVK